MTYTDFNKYVYDFCLKPENIGETIILSIDDSVIRSFCAEFDTTPIELQACIRRKFHYGWSLALKSDNNIPQFFGLIAIQIYVAHLMHRDNEYTASAYNPRLSSYLGVNKQSLQVLYREYQDDLWGELKVWGFKKEVDFMIPNAELGGWRYVKYPISQALLNQEDLKKLPRLFQIIGLRHNESISFDDFKDLINDSDKTPELTRHYHLVRSKLRELDKEDAVMYQIYDYYSKWDGNVDFSISGNEENAKINERVVRELSYLVLDNNLSFIDVFSQRDERLAKISLNDPELFQKLFSAENASNSSLLIFERDKFYDSWINKRYLDHDQTHLILSKANPQLEVAISKLDANFKIGSNSFYLIFEVDVDTDFKPKGFWSQYFSKRQRPFQFINGLMLGYHIWMHGNGPTIVFQNGAKAWLNGLPIVIDSSATYSCNQYPEGEHRLKVAGYAPISFFIKKPENNTSVLSHTGWHLDIEQCKWVPREDLFQISGLNIISDKLPKVSVRDWIDALTQKSDKTKCDSIVIQAIQRKRHGYLLDK